MHFTRSDEPFLSFAEVLVEPGATNRDPRLQRVDLTRHFRVLQLRIVDAGGQPFERVAVSLTPAAGDVGTFERSKTDQLGGVAWLIPVDCTDFWVETPHHDPTNVTWKAGAQDVRMTH